MPGIFEERERGYEAKWAHDEELHFKVLARRNDLLGRWAAGELRLLGSKADEYAMAVVHIGLIGKGADPVFEKIRGDFHAEKVSHSDQMVYRKMEEFFSIASNEVTK